MWNQKSIDAVDHSRFSSSFVKPLYNSYCFSKIPATVEHLLTNKRLATLPKDCFIQADGGYDIVFVLFIDAFGWKFFQRYSDKFPFLQRFVKKGIVSKITSQFPSTTAAHVTTINSGQEVGQTGVYEWFYYEPKVDRMIAPLLFSIAGDKTLGNLEKLNLSPSDIFPDKTLFQKLKKQKIDSFVVQPENIVGSPYSMTMTKGAHPICYKHLEEGLTTMTEAAFSGDGKSYFLLYFPDIDSAGHRYGTESDEFFKAVEHTMNALENFFAQKVSGSKKKIACLLTADHGMTSIDPKTTIYLNKLIPEIKEMIDLNRQGDLKIPAGSCRDMFLHIKKDKINEAHKILTDKLKGHSECFLVKDLIDRGFFGSKPPSATFLEKVADLVLLPLEGNSIWWYEKGRFEQHFYGSHGGLSKDEMESVFLFNASF